MRKAHGHSHRNAYIWKRGSGVLQAKFFNKRYTSRLLNTSRTYRKPMYTGRSGYPDWPVILAMTNSGLSTSATARKDTA